MSARWLCIFAAAGCARAAQPQPPSCAAIPGLDAVVQPGKLVFGEMHGTNESPDFIADAACAGAAKARVHVGLELPVEDAANLEKFMAGTADEGIRESAFWTTQQPYGMSSAAILRLLERLRALRRWGVDVFFFDDRRRGLEARDQSMAERISEERRRAPDDVYLVLCGNYHARKAIGVEGDPKKRWMTSFLAEEAGVLALDVRFTGGTAWACLLQADNTQSCGVHRFRANTADGTRRVTLEPIPESGFDGTYTVGALSASPPAYPH